MPVGRTAKSKASHQMDPYVLDKPLRSNDKGDTKQMAAETASHRSSPSISVPPLPIEILRDILRHTDNNALSQCMRVSKTFFRVVGPILYRSVIMKDKSQMSSLMFGSEVHQAEETDTRSTTINLKSPLLSLVQQMTIASHFCDEVIECSDYPRRFFDIGSSVDLCDINIPANAFDNLKTLLITPRIFGLERSGLCQGVERCSYLEGVRPKKTVIHNTNVGFEWGTQPKWPKCDDHTWITSPIVTWVLDESDRYKHAWSKRIECLDIAYGSLAQLRVIITRTTANFDRIAQMNPLRIGTADDPAVPTDIVAGDIKPYMECESTPVVIYLFRPLDSGGQDIARFTNEMYDCLDGRGRSRGIGQQPRKKPFDRGRQSLTIRSLSDYISEGFEDEFPSPELDYWREESKRRKALGMV